MSKKHKNQLAPDSKFVPSNDPKLEKFLEKINIDLKKHGSIHRCNTAGKMKWAISHLNESREKHESQMRLLDNVIAKMQKYEDKRKK